MPRVVFVVFARRGAARGVVSFAIFEPSRRWIYGFCGEVARPFGNGPRRAQEIKSGSFANAY
jgi:hypothetical protein